MVQAGAGLGTRVSIQCLKYPQPGFGAKVDLVLSQQESDDARGHHEKPEYNYSNPVALFEPLNQVPEAMNFS